LPVTSLGLSNTVSTERIPTGVPRLDAMLGGAGYYRGSSVLVSGTAGTGKSTLAAHFVDAACRRGERAIYFAFEESPDQIMRNMRSIGIDLSPWVQNGLLQFHAFFGLEMHLNVMHKVINAFKPQVVIVDPLNSFVVSDNETEVKTMLMRLVDFLKMNQVTGLFTSLTSGGDLLEQPDVAISSLIDTWLSLRVFEISGERNRGLYVLKSRGMAHSNQIREFLLTDHGVELRDVYIGTGGVLTGSARLAQEAQEKAAKTIRAQEIERLQLDLERKRKTMEAQVAAMRAEFELQEAEILKTIGQQQVREVQLVQERVDMGQNRKADAAAQPGKKEGSKNDKKPD
jgi:circadian clock protein KaiC